MSWAVIQSRSSLRMSPLDSWNWSRAQLKLARFQTSQLMPSSAIRSMAKVGSPRFAQKAITNVPPAMNAAAIVYMTMVTRAMSSFTR